MPFMECPHCKNQIEVPDLWEFFDCTNCEASLQLENNALKILKKPNENTSTSNRPAPPQDSEENPKPAPTKTVSENIQNLSENPPASKEDNIFPSEEESPPQSMEEPSPAAVAEPPLEAASAASTSAEEDLSETPPADPPLENFSENPSDAESIEGETPPPETLENNENLSNILDFEYSPHQKNHFTYHLQISSISSKALFEKICQILKNPRLKLNVPRQTTNKTLVVNNLNAVQMVYLVRKLSSLPVQIHWRQKSTLTQ